TLATLPGGRSRFAGSASGENRDRKAPVPRRDAIGMPEIRPSALGFDRSTGDPEQARRSRRAGGSAVADLRPSVVPNRTRRDSGDGATANREPGETPRESPSAPTIGAPGQRQRRYRLPQAP